jgi:hypothetical protein
LFFNYAENCVYNFEICLTDKNNFQSRFPGRFIFAGDTVDFNNHLNIQDVKEIVGNPDEENAEYGYIVYKNNFYELSFLFDADRKLTGIEGSTLDDLGGENTEKPRLE